MLFEPGKIENNQWKKDINKIQQTPELETQSAQDNTMTAVFKDAHDGGLAILNETSVPLSRPKKPKYSQVNCKSGRKSGLTPEDVKHDISTPKQGKRQKKRVKFKDNFIEPVEIESFKAYNLKMCFSELSMFYAPTKSDSWCKECMNSFSKCSIY
jgi:hypothetical protein